MKSSSLLSAIRSRIAIGVITAVVLSLFLVRYLSNNSPEAEAIVEQSKPIPAATSSQRQNQDHQATANKAGLNPVGHREFTGKAPVSPKLDDPDYAAHMQQRREEVERQRAELRKTHVPADTAANRAKLEEGMDPLDLPDAQGNVPQLDAVIDKTLLNYIPDMPIAEEGQELTPAQQELAERIRKAREAEPSELPLIDQTPADPSLVANMEAQISSMARQVGPEPDARTQPEAYGAWLERRKALSAAYNQLAELQHRPANTINNRRAIMAGVSPLELPAADGSGAYTGPTIIDKRLVNEAEPVVVDVPENASEETATE